MLISILVFPFLIGANALAAPPMPELALADWSVNALHSLAKEPPSRKEIEEFLGLSDTDDSPCSFTFTDLRQTGTLSLVAASDSSGGGFCNGIGIIDRTAYGFEATDLPSEAIGQGIDVSKLVQDIGGDGKLELVVEMEVGGYQGGVHCGLEWPVIFAWTGTSYADVSGQFKGYYRQQLAELERQLDGPAPKQAEVSEDQLVGPDNVRVAGRYQLIAPQQQSQALPAPPVRYCF
jgi:hypothetical protein